MGRNQHDYMQGMIVLFVSICSGIRLLSLSLIKVPAFYHVMYHLVFFYICSMKRKGQLRFICSFNSAYPIIKFVKCTLDKVVIHRYTECKSSGKTYA